MLTLEETLQDQEDLVTLCADRDLVTDEIFPHNSFYGLDFILKSYAGLSTTLPLKAVLPHGVQLSDYYVDAIEADVNLPAVFCYPDYRAAAYATQTAKVVFRSASPYLYVRHLIQPESVPERNGLIFFPVHSTHHATADVNSERLADALLELGAEYHPLTICVFWRDFLLGHHIPFQQRGFRIVSAGHMYDRYFLFRLFHLFSTHRYAAGNAVGSHLFYSVASGCSYFHLRGHEHHLQVHTEKLASTFGNISPEIMGPVEEIFSEPRPSMNEEQLHMTNYFLGAEHFKSPAALAEQILEAERLDRTWFAPPSDTVPIGLRFPPSYRRKLRRNSARARSVIYRSRQMLTSMGPKLLFLA